MAKTQIVSWSEINSYRMCPFQHDLAYRQRWSRPPVAGGALSRGSLWHLVMERHYQAQTATSPQGATTAQVGDLLCDPRSGEQSEDQELIQWMYDGYVEHYGYRDLVDDGWRVLGVEYANDFWLPTDRGGRSRFKIKMKIDLVVRDPQGRTWIWDHKSGKDLPSDRMLELDDQFALYAWGLRQLGKPIYGMIHNGARTQRNKSKPQPLDERFRRTLLVRTGAELEQVALDAYHTAKRAWMPGIVPERNPDPDRCRWRCDFTEDCLLSRKQTPANQESVLRSSLEAHGFEINKERH